MMEKQRVLRKLERKRGAKNEQFDRNATFDTFFSMDINSRFNKIQYEIN